MKKITALNCLLCVWSPVSGAWTINVDERDGGAWISVTEASTCDGGVYQFFGGNSHAQAQLLEATVPIPSRPGFAWRVTPAPAAWMWIQGWKPWSCNNPADVSAALAAGGNPVFQPLPYPTSNSRPSITMHHLAGGTIWPANATWGQAVDPTTCDATQPADINYGTMSADAIPTAPYGTDVAVTCTGDTKVKATFTFSDGTDYNVLNNGIRIQLKVGGWPGGGVGFTFNAYKGVPLLVNANATLSAPGKVTEGIFRTIGVVKLSYD